MFKLMNHLTNNLIYIVALAFLFNKIDHSTDIIKNDKKSRHDIYIFSIFFSVLAIIGTYTGLDLNGAILNTRNIGVIAGGLLAGPQVGITAGLISGLHRLTLNTGNASAIACSISTVLGGVLSGLLHSKTNKNNRYIYGFIVGCVVESVSMLLILLISSDYEAAIALVNTIYVPMVLTNSVGVFLLIIIIETIINKTEIYDGQQAKIALEIANKTLPYFRENESLDEVCKIILESLDAKAVIITDKANIIALYSTDDIPKICFNNIRSTVTKKVIETGQLLVTGKNNEDHSDDFLFISDSIKSSIISPLFEDKQISGTLKIFFDTHEKATEKNRYLAIGLSQLISTQLEIRKMNSLISAAKNAELKALQSQINPHFLFNALNTTASFVRFDPIKAREVIIDLAHYMRYNLENATKVVTLKKELEQVKAYASIEKARFKDKLTLIYEIDEDALDTEIPSLIIQPLVENSIKHGLLPKRDGGIVKIIVEKLEDKTSIIVEDDGVGIDQNVIDTLDATIENNIGLRNVHTRLKLIYGKGLEIQRLNKGTRICFII